MKKGDILLIGSDVLQVLDDASDSGRIFKDFAWVQFMDRDETSHLDLSSRDIENLGQSPGVLLQYTIGRSIHTRLNKLGKI